MNEYRVSLDVYNGPLDLLLYLIRRDELDIRDIPISRITAQYIQYVDMLQQLDPNLAGEFLVMAASLMEIKTRMLLPSPPPAQGATRESLALDPREELVRQLLEYKAFKDAAGELQDAAVLQAMKFPRGPATDTHPDESYDIEDVQVWDLLDAFQKLMAAIGQQSRQHEVIYDDTPVELHAADVVDRLGREGPMSFSQIFEGRTGRAEIIGLFLALLELIRQKRIFAVQESNFAEIQIVLNPNPPALDADDHVAAFAGAQVPVETPIEPARSDEPAIADQSDPLPAPPAEYPPAPDDAQDLGRYVPQAQPSASQGAAAGDMDWDGPSKVEDDDDDPGKDHATGL